MTITIKKVLDLITPALTEKEQELKALPSQALTVFKQNTPKRSGNARNKTRLEGANTIHANYPYATRLDNGYSRQSPQGMSKPTDIFVRKRLNAIMRKK